MLSKFVKLKNNKNMKNTLSQLLFLALAFFIISASSCEKEKEPDLVPITTTGENTMGFYLDGVTYNKKGVFNFGNPDGVRWGKYADGKIEFSGGGGDPYGSIMISFYEIQGIKKYTLSKLTSTTGLGEFIDDAPLGGNEYYTNENVTGTMEILRLDDHIIAGTFDIQLQDPNSGKIIHLTDGRFDIKQ